VASSTGSLVGCCVQGVRSLRARIGYLDAADSFNKESSLASQRKPVMSTYSPKPGDITRSWHVIDANDVVLGRLAVTAATLLRGKHKPTFAPHIDGGDFVIVVNASKIALTGNKRTDKLARRHSGRPGGLKSVPYGELLDRDPRKAVELAVWGMLPKNKLSRRLIRKLKVYAGPEHPHSAQQPKPYAISQIAQ
jgi:large subunit ribosomal protein L13